jgi:pyruvate dehydrogenase E2 component (dihydrolipoamide acetyltransferase)
MPADVIMPALGMAQDTGTVLRWLKAEGDHVAAGEPLMEVETDKATVEVEAPCDGTLADVCAAEGDEVPVGQVVARVVGVGSDPVPAKPAGAGNGRRRKLASPKARRIAAELGVDLGALTGSGPGGAVVAADVQRVEAPSPIPEPPAAAPPAPERSVWRVMAERTTQSWQTAPHFFLRRQVDAGRLNSWRDAARARPALDRASHTDLLVMVAAAALRRHPEVNATWAGAAPERLSDVNVAVAVATEAGLVVPVVHRADTLSLEQIVARRIELVERARAGRLAPDDLTGGTFTISNLGMFGVDSFDAILNAPQAAILAVGRIADRVVAVDGAAVVRPAADLSVSFDHRVVDGAMGARFLETLAGLIEEPAGLIA